MIEEENVLSQVIASFSAPSQFHIYSTYYSIQEHFDAHHGTDFEDGDYTQRSQQLADFAHHVEEQC